MTTIFDTLDDYLRRLAASQRTPSLALALFDAEGIVHLAVAGDSQPDPRTTLFPIGSITKSFVAFAIMQLAEAGRLDLHAPVTDYLPWFEVQTQYAPITLHHLLTHSSGLTGIIDRSPDVRAAAWALRETETAWAPGERFLYSDAGYQALALVLERLTGRAFAEVLRSQIFEPLGMANSFGAVTHDLRPRLACGLVPLYDDRPSHAGSPLVAAPFIEMSAGDTSVAATVEDLAQFGRMLLNGGQGPHGRLLSEAGCAALSRPAMPADLSPWEHYGYGLLLRQLDGFRHLGHDGGVPGYGARLVVDVDNGLGVALTTGRPSERDAAWTALRLWRSSLLGLPLEAIDLALPDALRVSQAGDYEGQYHASDGATLTLEAAGDRLLLVTGQTRTALEPRGDDRFYAPHPAFDRFLLAFQRDANGQVVEAMHGERWHPGSRYTGPREFDCPPEWRGYAGHYQAHNPWLTNFRVLLRKGALWLAWTHGDEDPLLPLGGAAFQIGSDPTPERLRFGQIVEGQALCANLSACDYYRFFTD